MHPGIYADVLRILHGISAILLRSCQTFVGSRITSICVFIGQTSRFSCASLVRHLKLVHWEQRLHRCSRYLFSISFSCCLKDRTEAGAGGRLMLGGGGGGLPAWRAADGQLPLSIAAWPSVVIVPPSSTQPISPGVLRRAPCGPSTAWLRVCCAGWCPGPLLAGCGGMEVRPR